MVTLLVVVIMLVVFQELPSLLISQIARCAPSL